MKKRFKKTGGSYRLILLDYSMPECDGIQAVKKFKSFMEANLPESEHSFICCVSAYSSNGHRLKAATAGMNYFLAKPIAQEAMQIVLEKAGLIEETKETK